MQANQVQRGIVSVRAETDVKALIEGVNKAFADFKAEHSKQLEDVKKGQADALQALKVDRINAEITSLQTAVDEANAKIAAAQMNGGAGSRVKDKEYTDAFHAHMKRGDIQASLNKGAAAEGGYLAPTEWDRSIVDKLVLVSPMRQLATVQTISTNGFTKLVNLKGTASGWVGESAARPETATPTFGSVTYNTGEIYANPAATQQMLDDAEVNLEAWLAGEVEQEFAKQEGAAFVNGDGVSKPIGLLQYATGGVATHPLGQIANLGSGAVGAITADAILDLIHALPTAFTLGARFAMNRSTEGTIRKLKDGQGNYLWQPSYQAGAPATLAGYAISEVPDMPNVAAGALAVAFGNFARTYLVIDRVGVRVLRDPFSNKPFVQFYTTKRVGGGLLTPEPMKFIKVNAV
jgi:HK97 family phage major capsid protein